jgi:gas vesicle protein GvpL/GvpF
MASATKRGPIYVYGILRSDHAVLGTKGVLDAGIGTVEHGKVAAIASPVPSLSVRAKRRDLLRHSDVLQEAFADGAVLPFRFGTVFPDREALVDEVLAPRHDELHGLLKQFADAGELRLRAAYHDQESVLAAVVRSDPAIARLRETAKGRAGTDPGLLRLGEAVAKAFAGKRDADADAIVSRLSKHADEVRVDDRTEELEVVRASFLVRRRKTSKFEELLESVALTHRHLIQFVCTGPVPPHSFVSLDGG